VQKQKAKTKQNSLKIRSTENYPYAATLIKFSQLFDKTDS